MKIGIIGLGLIGGSLGLDLRQQGHHVVGLSRRAETGELALGQGVVDEVSGDLAGLAQTELIFLCTPLDVLVPTVGLLVRHLNHNTILTDVGSAKAEVVRGLQGLWPNFVGGHPMAGKSETGLGMAEAGLFHGKPYVITPTTKTPQTAIETVQTIVQSLGSILYTCTPEEHDQAVALISHLPVMISTSLIQTCIQELPSQSPKNPGSTVQTLAQQFASSGFRDTSRVGGGGPKLGLMMARYNHASLVKSLHLYRHQLEKITTLVEQQDWAGLEKVLRDSQAARPKFL